MKKLANLKGVKALNKNKQKEIIGGGKYGPCGDTGGIIVSSWYCDVGIYGTVYGNGACWACY